jgi:hypothetical protein
VPAFPLPSAGQDALVVPAPAPGAGNWTGAPSAVQDDDGSWVVAYRIRTADRRGAEVIVARSGDGEHLATVAGLTRERFAAESLERPALVRAQGGRWRLYVSCATPGTKHWRIELLEAADPAALAGADAVPVFPGSPRLAVKDPVVRRHPRGWQAWVCCHPLDRRGEEDRMQTSYATSGNGLVWRWRGTALSGRPGAWDARGARVTAVLPDGRAAYDGRATKEENFSERTGLAVPGDRPGALVAAGDGPMAGMRYLDAVPLAGGYRLYYEAPLEDGSHELRTVFVPTQP